MTFVFTWNSAFLAAPGDNENESLGASRIRDFKNAFTERFQVCFSLAGNSSDGLLNEALFLVQATAPTTGPGLYAFNNTTTGNNELYFLDNNSNTTQLTASGKLANSPIPSGTIMHFLQAAVPVGWTQSTGYNDVVIRLVSDASGGSGGGSWAISGLQDAGHVLTINEMPNHSHTYNTFGGAGSGVTPGSGAAINNGISTSAVGGNAAHYHTISGNGAWRPAYVNACVGVKN
jgi:hypothetical protein